MDSTPTPPLQADAEGGPSRQSQSESPPPPPSQPPQPPQAESQPRSRSPSPPQQLDHVHQPQPQSPISSPALSRPSPSFPNPPTPQTEDAGEDYFHRVSPPPPQRSRLSTFSISRLPRSTPSENRPPARPEASRQSSIRIRLSNASLDRAQPATPEPGPEHAEHRGGRSRSGSQSSVASAPADTTNSAWSRPVIQPDPAGPSRNPRKMVQASLPRLTEEGSRPTMAELGLAPDPQPRRPSMAPSDAAADEDGEHEEKASPGPAPSPEKRNRLRRMSRFFWPSKARRGSIGRASVMSAESRHDEEYHEELVDWLDIIGESPACAGGLCMSNHGASCRP